MSDGISEARSGTYFSDRSSPEMTDLEKLKKEMNHLINWHSDLGKAINMLANKIDSFDDSKEIT